MLFRVYSCSGSMALNVGYVRLKENETRKKDESVNIEKKR